MLLEYHLLSDFGRGLLQGSINTIQNILHDSLNFLETFRRKTKDLFSLSQTSVIKVDRSCERRKKKLYLKIIKSFFKLAKL